MATREKLDSNAKRNAQLKPLCIRLDPNDPADALRLTTWASLENKTAFIRQCLDRAREGKEDEQK